MELFLMVMCVSVLGLALSGLAFSAATQDVRAAEEAPRPADAVAARPRFFADNVVVPMGASAQGPAVPIEALLLQIERHVRLEQAAAEAFHEAPTAQSLHSRTTSPLVH